MQDHLQFDFGGQQFGSSNGRVSDLNLPNDFEIMPADNNMIEDSDSFKPGMSDNEAGNQDAGNQDAGNQDKGFQMGFKFDHGQDLKNAAQNQMYADQKYVEK